MERLIADMKRRIGGNEFAVNSLMPSIRTLAAHYSASPSTVEAALREMCELELLQRVPRRGFKILGRQVEQRGRIAILHQAYGMLDPRPAIAAAICDRLESLGYQWDEFDLMVRRPEPDFLKKNYAAVIFARQLHLSDYPDLLAAHGIIQVIAGRETDIGTPSSFVDRQSLIDATVRMLFAMGHRDITLVVRDTGKYFYPAMLDTYRRVFAELGLAYDDDALAVMTDDFELGAYLCGRRILARSKLPSVIIVSRDYQACGINQACAEKGLILGRDISLVGYDDIGWRAGHDLLTTYREPCEELGRGAVDVLHSILSGDGGPLQREVVPKLILRRTLCPIPPAAIPAK